MAKPKSEASCEIDLQSLTLKPSKTHIAFPAKGFANSDINSQELLFFNSAQSSFAILSKEGINVDIKSSDKEGTRTFRSFV